QKIWSLGKLVARTSPDVAIGFMHSAFVPLGLAALGTRYPVIASEHTAVDHYRSRPMQFRLVRWSARWVARATVPSENIRAQFPSTIRERMVVIPNPVAMPEKRKRPPPRAGRSLLAVGAFREEKGHA